MNIQISTKQSQEIDKIKITIEVPEYNDEVNYLLKYINKITNKEIIGKRDGKIYFFNINDIYMFFSEGKNISFRTKDDVYDTNSRLYELEEILPNDRFVRISHNAIVNLSKIEYFDTNITGEILVKMKNGIIEYVSKRRIPEIMKIIKNKGVK